MAGRISYQSIPTTALMNESLRRRLSPEEFEYYHYENLPPLTYGQLASRAGAESEEKSIWERLDPSNLFAPSEEDIQKRQQLLEELYEASIQQAQDTGLTIDEFRFNEDYYDKDKILQGLASRLLTINPNEKGGFDVYRVAAYTEDNKPIRESKPIAFTNNKGELVPYFYTIDTTEYIGGGVDYGTPVTVQRKLSHEEVAATAKKDIQELNKQSAFWDEALSHPMGNFGRDVGTILFGRKYTPVNIGDKGDIGSTYETSKQTGRLVRGLRDIIGFSTLTGLLGAPPAVIGAVAGAYNIPEYLGDASTGMTTWESAVGKSLFDVGTGALTMGLYSKYLGKTPDIIAKAISQGKNPVAVAAKQLVKLNAGQSVFNAGNVLADMYLDALGSGRQIDLNQFGEEFVKNAGITLGINLALELVPGTSASYGMLKIGKSGARYQNAMQLLENITPENREQLAKVWNYIVDNFDGIERNINFQRQLTYSAIRAKNAGIIDKWDNELIKQMKLAGYVNKIDDAVIAKQLIESVREMHDGIKYAGQSYKVKYDPVNNIFYNETIKAPGTTADATAGTVARPTTETVAQETMNVPPQEKVPTETETRPPAREITKEDIASIKQNIESSMVALTKEQRSKFLNKLVDYGFADKKANNKIDFGSKAPDILDLAQHFKQGESLLRIFSGASEPNYHNVTNPEWMFANNTLVKKTFLDPEDKINLIRAKNELGTFYDDIKKEIIRQTEIKTGNTPPSYVVDELIGKLYGVSAQGEGSIRQKFIEKYSAVKDNNYAGASQEYLLNKFGEYLHGKTIVDLNRPTTLEASTQPKLLEPPKLPTYEDYLRLIQARNAESGFYKDLYENINKIRPISLEESATKYRESRQPTPEELSLEEQYPVLRNVRMKETGTPYQTEKLEDVLARGQRSQEFYDRINRQLQDVAAEEKIPTREQVEAEKRRSQEIQKWMRENTQSEGTGFTKLKKIAKKKVGDIAEAETPPVEKEAIKGENELVFKETEPTEREIKAIVKDEPEAVKNETVEETVNKNLEEDADNLVSDLDKQLRKTTTKKLKAKATTQEQPTQEVIPGEQALQNIEGEANIAKTGGKKISQKQADKIVQEELNKINKNLDKIEGVKSTKKKSKYEAFQQKLKEAEENLVKSEEEYNRIKKEYIEKGIIDKQGVIVGGTSKEVATYNKAYNNLKLRKKIYNAILAGESVSRILKENKSALLATTGLITSESLPDDEEYDELKKLTRTAGIFGLAFPYRSAKHKVIKLLNPLLVDKVGFETIRKVGATRLQRMMDSPMFKEWMTKGVYQKDGTFKKLTEDEAVQFATDVLKHVDYQSKKGFTVLQKMLQNPQHYSFDVAENNNPLLKDYYRRIAIKGLQGNNIFNEKFKPKITTAEVDLFSTVRNIEDLSRIIHVNDVIRRKIINLKLAAKGGKISDDAAKSAIEELIKPENIKQEFKNLNTIPDEFKEAWNGKLTTDDEIDFLYNGYVKWRKYQDALYEAERYGQIADALGISPDEFDSFKKKARTALEDYVKAKKEIRTLRETFKELKKLAPSPETQEFQLLFETAQRLKELVKKTRIKIDGKDYQQIKTALKWVEHMDDFLENSRLNQYMDMRTTWRGETDDKFKYGVKVVEVTRKNPKATKLEEDIEMLKNEPYSPAIEKKLRQKRMAWNIAEKETAEARKSGTDFYDVPPELTDQKFMYKFKSKRAKDDFIYKMLADRNAKQVVAETGQTKYAIYEMDKVDMYGRPILNPDGTPQRALYRINDAIDFNAMHYAITSRDALKTMLYRAIKDGGFNEKIRKSMADKLSIIEQGLDNLETFGDDVASKNISDSIYILKRIIEGASYPESTLKEALENLTRYKPPDAYHTYNYLGNSPITKNEYSKYLKNIKNITQDKALLGLERGLTMKAVDDVLTENLQMGLTQTRLYEDLLNFRDYFYQRPTNYAIWKRDITALASNTLNAVQRYEAAKAMAFNLGTMPTNHIYAFLDVIGTSNNPVLGAFRFAKNYYKVFKLAYNKTSELSARQLELMGVPKDKIEAIQNVLTKDGIRVFGKPEIDAKGNLTPEGLQTHIKNQIANLMVIRDIGSSSPTQAAFHNNLTKIENIGYAPTKITEFVNRNLSAFAALDDIVSKFPFDPKKISIEDYVKWVGDEIQLYAGKTNGIFTPLYNSKLENFIMKMPGGRSLVMLARPFMRSLYNIHENIHTLIYGGSLTDVGNTRIKALNKLLARAFVGWILAGTKAIPLIMDTIDLADKAIKNINNEKDDPNLAQETFRENLHKKVRDWGRSKFAQSIFGKKLSDADLDKLVLAWERGLPGLFGIGLNVDERVGSLLDPYMLQALDRQLKSFKKIGTGGMNEENLEDFYRAFFMSGIVRATEAANQAVEGKRMSKVAMPFHSKGYKELNYLNKEFTYGDALKFLLFGRPAEEKLALEMKYSPSGEGREFITEYGKRENLKKLLSLPGIEFKGPRLFSYKETKEGKVEKLLEKTNIKDNKMLLYDRTLAIYNSDRYKKAIENAQKELDNIIEKNPSIVRRASEGITTEIPKLDSRDVKDYVERLKNRVNQFYYTKAVHEALNENKRELLGNKVILEPLFLRTPVYAYDKKRMVFLDKADFEKQGVYYALSSLDKTYKEVINTDGRRNRRKPVKYEY